MKDIKIEHKAPEDFGDRIALNAVRFLRFSMDTLTGYKHPKEDSDPKVAAKALMTERQWLIRMIFLESIAAVPGMVGGMLRHLHSLRRMKRDNGWVGSPPCKPKSTDWR
jgi:ubiquinol oxidase